jgi:hypothetical protein
VRKVPDEGWMWGCKLMRKIICLLLFMFSSMTFADSDVYRSEDENGNISYSDKPSDGGEKVTVAPVQTYVSPKVEDRYANDEPQKAEKTANYSSLKILQPAQHQTFRGDSLGNINVRVQLPELAPDDYFIVTMDGAPRSEPSNEAKPIQLQNVDRGAHVLQAEIHDKSGAVVAKSEPIEFYMMLPTMIHHR